MEKEKKEAIAFGLVLTLSASSFVSATIVSQQQLQENKQQQEKSK